MATLSGQQPTSSRWSRLAALALTLVLVGAGSYGLFVWTSGMGHSSLFEIAREEGLCEAENDCTSAVNMMYEIASEKYGMSGPHLDWCLGVDSWAAAKVYRGGWLKSIAVWFMYLPCGSMKDA